MKTHPFKSSVVKWCTALGIMLTILVVTIPVAIYFFLKRGGAVTVDDSGMTVKGLGLSPQRWDFNDLQRIGLLNIQVDAAFGQGINGGRVAKNLCAITKGGKKLKFMVSRFENDDALIELVASKTGLTLEALAMGMNGPKWPNA